MTNTPLLLALAALTLSPTPAAAVQATAAGQSAKQSEADPIVVEGRRRAIESTLKQMLDPTDRGQLARFETGICPRVFGFPADWTATLETTIRDNIGDAGGKALDPGCGPNAIVIFIYEPQTLMKALGDRMPDLFEDRAQREALASRQRAVTSWHVTDLMSRDGAPLEKVNQIDVNGMGMPADAYVVRNAGISRLVTNIREDMRMGFVVIDAQRTHGLTLRQLADLVTMHLMLDVRADAGKDAGDSILALFETRPAGVAPPLRMSATDRAVLGGYYGLEKTNYRASRQRDRVAREAAKALAAGDER